MIDADKIIDVDINPAREEMARKFIMTHFFNPNEFENVVAAIVQSSGRPARRHMPLRLPHSVLGCAFQTTILAGLERNIVDEVLISPMGIWVVRIAADHGAGEIQNASSRLLPPIGSLSQSPPAPLRRSRDPPLQESFSANHFAQRRSLVVDHAQDQIDDFLSPCD